MVCISKHKKIKCIFLLDWKGPHLICEGIFPWVGVGEWIGWGDNVLDLKYIISKNKKGRKIWPDVNS